MKGLAKIPFLRPVLLFLKPNCQALCLVALLLYLPREPFSNNYPATTDHQDHLLHSPVAPILEENALQSLALAPKPSGNSLFCLVSTLHHLGQQPPIGYQHTEPTKGAEKELVVNWKGFSNLFILFCFWKVMSVTASIKKYLSQKMFKYNEDNPGLKSSPTIYYLCELEKLFNCYGDNNSTSHIGLG